MKLNQKFSVSKNAIGLGSKSVIPSISTFSDKRAAFIKLLIRCELNKNNIEYLIYHDAGRSIYNDYSLTSFPKKIIE